MSQLIITWAIMMNHTMFRRSIKIWKMDDIEKPFTA
tara:strand:+ start:107 stop:214 length:108 start_codon:yes stop_codon:yes gene_type:complete